jgi:hypothetical protein
MDYRDDCSSHQAPSLAELERHDGLNQQRIGYLARGRAGVVDVVLNRNADGSAAGSASLAESGCAASTAIARCAPAAPCDTSIAQASFGKGPPLDCRLDFATGRGPDSSITGMAFSCRQCTTKTRCRPQRRGTCSAPRSFQSNRCGGHHPVGVPKKTGVMCRLSGVAFSRLGFSARLSLLFIAVAITVVVRTGRRFSPDSAGRQQRDDCDQEENRSRHS